MIERYDLIVIGAGPSGLSAAIEAAKNGMKPIWAPISSIAFANVFCKVLLAETPPASTILL